MTSNIATASLVRWGTAIAAVVALIGFVGIGFDKSWGSPVSMVACAIALVGVVLMVVGVPIGGNSSPGRR